MSLATKLIVTAGGAIVLLLATVNYLIFGVYLGEETQSPGVNLGAAFLCFAFVLNLPIAAGWVIHMLSQKK